MDALGMDPHLVEAMTFTLRTMPHQVRFPTQTLVIPTAHQKDTPLQAPLPDHFSLVPITSNQLKLKFSIKLLYEAEHVEVQVLNYLRDHLKQ